jgi:FkbM family methyltransferase
MPVTDARDVATSKSLEAHWYEDAAFVASLPRSFRIYAAYSRAMSDRKSRRVRGGSFLLRALQRIVVGVGATRIACLRARPDLRIWVDLADERLLEVFYEARSQNPEQMALESLLHEGDSFIDVGANYGTFSLVAARIVGPSGRVIAIEPQPQLTELIRRSADANGFTNLEVHQLATGSRAGAADIYVPHRDTGRAGIHRAFSGKSAHNTLRVRVDRLDDAIDWRRLPGNLVIKIDVEGAERDTIDGAAGLITERRPAMIAELNPWSARAAGYAVEDLLDSLTEKGYDSFVPAAAFAGLAPETLSTDRQQNIVATGAMTGLRSNGIFSVPSVRTTETKFTHESSRPSA